MKHLLTVLLIFIFTFDVEAQLFSSSEAPRTPAEQTVIDIYKEANKAVVNLSIKSISKDFFYPVYQEGSGSGVIIDKDSGLIITNFHVIKNANQVKALLADGNTYDVKLVGEDPNNELAILKIIDPPSNLTELPLGDSSSLEVGQNVLAIGNPFGLNRTLTSGIVSSLGRSIRGDHGTLINDVIQTDAAINPGNSGGPLLDMAGKIIGLNTAILSKSGDYAGIGFAIPANYIKKVLPQLLEFGKIREPKIGVVIAQTDSGAVILMVQPGSPADQAGLEGAQKIVKRGNFTSYFVDFNNADFILEINDKKIQTKEQAETEILKSKAENELILKVKKIGQKPRVLKLKPILE